jgi:hypothetical protein
MNCKAAIAGAVLAAGACVVTPGAGWPETIKIPSQVDGGCCSTSAGSDPQHDPAATEKGSDIPGVDRPAASDHPEGDTGLPAIGASSAPDSLAPGSGSETRDHAQAVLGPVADPEPSTLTRLLIVFSDLRERVFGGP